LAFAQTLRLKKVSADLWRGFANIGAADARLAKRT